MDGRQTLNIPAREELLKKAGDLKVLPFVAKKILDTIGNEDASIEELGDIIEKDQTVTARVLKISNSALYGLRQEVTSLNHAIMVLGFKTIRSLVLSVSTKSLYKSFGMKEKIIWDHSIGAAIAAKIISKGMGSDTGEMAFIGGLMHDLGKVVLNNETPDIFVQVMMKTYNDGADSLDAENEVYGYTHTEIGAGVMERWGFPPLLVKIVEGHHLNNGKLENIADPLTAKVTAVVHLADQICRKLGIGTRSPDEALVLDSLISAEFLEIPEEKLNEMLEETRETYCNEKAVFE
jgi:putative nucleotidyltransferase with HDIG domain